MLKGVYERQPGQFQSHNRFVPCPLPVSLRSTNLGSVPSRIPRIRCKLACICHSGADCAYSQGTGNDVQEHVAHFAGRRDYPGCSDGGDSTLIPGSPEDIYVLT